MDCVPMGRLLHIFAQVQFPCFCPKLSRDSQSPRDFTYVLQMQFQPSEDVLISFHDAKNVCRSSSCLSLAAPICSPGLKSVIPHPTPFCSLGELSGFVVRSWSPYHHTDPSSSVSTQIHMYTHLPAHTLSISSFDSQTHMR